MTNPLRCDQESVVSRSTCWNRHHWHLVNYWLVHLLFDKIMFTVGSVSRHYRPTYWPTLAQLIHWLSVNQYMANILADSWLCQLNIFRGLVKCQLGISCLLLIRLPIHVSVEFQLNIDWHIDQNSIDIWPIVNLITQPTLDWLSVNKAAMYWPIVDW